MRILNTGRAKSTSPAVKPMVTPDSDQIADELTPVQQVCPVELYRPTVSDRRHH